MKIENPNKKLLYFLISLIVLILAFSLISTKNCKEPNTWNITTGNQTWYMRNSFDFDEIKRYNTSDENGDVWLAYTSPPSQGPGYGIPETSMKVVIRKLAAIAMYDAGNNIDANCTSVEYNETISNLELTDWIFGVREGALGYNRTVCIKTKQENYAKIIFPKGDDRNFELTVYKKNKCAGIAFAYQPEPVSSVWVSPEIISEFQTKNEVSVIVDLRDKIGNFSEEERKRLNNNKEDEVLSTLTKEEFKLRYKYTMFNSFTGTITKQGFEKLKNNPDVVKLSFDHTFKALLSESVPLINANKTWGTKINDKNLTGSDLSICVVDSGVNYYHPDLGGCFGSGCKVVGGYDFANNDTDPMDDNGHGTHVAGIAAANGVIRGVAPEANVLAIKVLNSSGHGSEGDIRKGVDWCITNKELYNISAIVLSIAMSDEYDNGIIYNSSCDSNGTLVVAVNNASAQGIFVSAASGNDGNKTGITSPACGSNVIAVGSTYDSDVGFNRPCIKHTSNDGCLAYCEDSLTYADKVSCYSNRGALLDLLAPGSRINSTSVTGVYVESEGTSMSAPHAAGAAVLLIQYEKAKYNRTLTPAEVEARFKETGKLVFDNETNLTFPRIDAYAAIFPLDAYNLDRIYANDTSQTFRFEIANNYNNKTANVHWSADMGDGTVINSSQTITLAPKETVFVYIEHNYTSGEGYTINASATSGNLSDEERLIINAGNLIITNLGVPYANQTERTFGFTVLNNMPNSLTSLNWTLQTGENNITADHLFNLTAGERVFVYAQYAYGATGDYNVTANAFNSDNSDSKTMKVTV